MEHLDHVGQVVLTLGVLRVQPAQGGGQNAAAEAVDRGVDLVDLALLVGGVSLLYHLADPAVLAPHHPAVAGGVLHAGCQQGAGRFGLTMSAHQGGDGLGPQQRRVARQDEHVAVVIEIVVGESGEPDADRVAGSPLHALLDELEHEVWGLFLQLLGDPLRTVAHHDDRPARLALTQGIEHVQQHGPATQQVERLGSHRPHTGALSGGEHDGRQRAGGHDL